MMKRRWICLLIGLCFVFTGTVAAAQDTSGTDSDSVEKMLEEIEKRQATDALAEESPEPAPAAAPVEASQVETDAPKPAPAPSVKDTPTVAAETPKNEIAPGVYGHIHPRAAVGLLGTNLASDFGIMLEASGKYLGMFVRGGAYLPTNHEIEYAFDFGVGFHIYPFGTAPGGFYFGPALSILHFCYDPGPFVGMPTVTEEMQDYNIREIMGINTTRNMPTQYDLTVPMIDIGYKHWFDFGMTLGIEASAGYGVSDQKSQHSSEMYVMVTPVIGYGW